MEYVDGENLATLMRRIDRLSPDKALDIARQLCAGLGAAHDRGVLHRDLKPENVMLDGQGKVRITDFGLAGLEDELRGDDVRSGTPAYMSPEQLTGNEVTARSDVYSLGLVLYELFTGRKAFEGRSFGEMLRKHRDERPVDPSSLVPGIDPAVESTILRCIAKDPAARPSSALSVAALLPGGDPLSAALAAGITPSPEMVAAAGESFGLKGRTAGLCLALVLVAVIVSPFLEEAVQLFGRVPAEKAPAVLEDRARELVKRLLPGNDPADSRIGLESDPAQIRYVRENDASPARWDGLATGDPPAITFYYRQSAHALVSTSLIGRVFWGNPPPWVLSGNAGMRLDLRGRLVAFYWVPPQVETEEGQAPAPDWGPLLAETGLAASSLVSVVPRWTPPVYADARAAWEGAYPARPGLRVRVEAASYRGRPVSFAVVAPWTRPERMLPRDYTKGEKAAFTLMIGVILVLVGMGAFLARRNLRLGRGDRRGAMRLAAYVFLITTVFWGGLNADHVADLAGEVMIMVRGTGFALFQAAMLWIFYVALEPYARRLRPQTLISWNRILSGRPGHPVVARDILFGAAWGAACAILFPLALRLPEWLGQPPSDPTAASLDVLLAPRRLVAFLVGIQLDALFLGLGSLLLFVVLRLLIRHDYLAGLLVSLLLSVFQATGLGAEPWLRAAISFVMMATYTLLLLRVGLVAAIVALYVSTLLIALPLTTSLGDWYSGPTVAAAVVVTAIALYAFRTSARHTPAAA
jgi:serine/threonine-protein kinase